MGPRPATNQPISISGLCRPPAPSATNTHARVCHRTTSFGERRHQSGPVALDTSKKPPRRSHIVQTWGRVPSQLELGARDEPRRRSRNTEHNAILCSARHCPEVGCPPRTTNRGGTDHRPSRAQRSCICTSTITVGRGWLGGTPRLRRDELPARVAGTPRGRKKRYLNRAGQRCAARLHESGTLQIQGVRQRVRSLSGSIPPQSPTNTRRKSCSASTQKSARYDNGRASS